MEKWKDRSGDKAQADRENNKQGRLFEGSQVP